MLRRADANVKQTPSKGRTDERTDEIRDALIRPFVRSFVSLSVVSVRGVHSTRRMNSDAS